MFYFKVCVIHTILHSLICVTNPQLVINVKNQGGDVLRESISANITEDTVSLEFLRSDGVFITQVIDFVNEAQLIKAIIPGEEELGQSNTIQKVCFVTYSDKTDFIAPDAMIKLRQKNPGTIRVAEEDRGDITLTMDVWLSVNGNSITPLISKYCSEYDTRIYSSKQDLDKWGRRRGTDPKQFNSFVTTFPESALDTNKMGETAQYPYCSTVNSMKHECKCRFHVCIIWYPCGLKYCKGKTQANVPAQSLSYRCGIKTCRRCLSYEFYVKQKSQCVWDQ